MATRSMSVLWPRPDDREAIVDSVGAKVLAPSSDPATERRRDRSVVAQVKAEEGARTEPAERQRGRMDKDGARRYKDQV